METKIHQIYHSFKKGVELQDIPVYRRKVGATIEFCEEHNIPYKMWNEDMCNQLINKYPEYKELYDTFRYKIQKVDFIKYLILYDEGGIYIDCDVSPVIELDKLFKMEQFFVRWNDCKRKLPYNAVLGSKSKNPLYKDIMSEVFYSVEAKNRQDIYKKWVGRYVFQTTGHYALQRVLKKYPKVEKLDIMYIRSKGKKIVGEDAMFHDDNASIWYEGGKVV